MRFFELLTLPRREQAFHSLMERLPDGTFFYYPYGSKNIFFKRRYVVSSEEGARRIAEQYAAAGLVAVIFTFILLGFLIGALLAWRDTFVRFFVTYPWMVLVAFALLTFAPYAPMWITRRYAGALTEATPRTFAEAAVAQEEFTGRTPLWVITAFLGAMILWAGWTAVKQLAKGETFIGVFMLVNVLFLAPLLFVAPVAWKMKRLRAENERLESLVASRTEELRALNATLEGRTVELQDANRQMKEALQQQMATADVLKVISRSPNDVQPVFEAIVKSARELCNASNAYAFRYDGERMHYVTCTDTRPEILEFFHGAWQPDNSTLSGRVALSRRTLEVEDVAADEDYNARIRGPIERRGLGVPMLRDGNPVGVLVVNWKDPGPIPKESRQVLETFADQAVIAVENARLFNEIRQKSVELDAANRHKSEFLANMSHELRTPLNAIIGFSEVILSGMAGEVPNKQKEFIGDIRGSGKHLLSLINDILDLSKIEAGRMELELAEFDLSTAIENAITLVRERATRHGILLSSHVNPALTTLRADERKFKQILINLLSNSVKFTPAGGRVTVSARRVDAGTEVAVADTGVGIARDDLETVFEEFRQVGKNETRVEGTGLGLALVRKFVELHHGRIRVESDLGKGSTFTVFLPDAGVVAVESREVESKPG